MAATNEFITMKLNLDSQLTDNIIQSICTLVSAAINTKVKLYRIYQKLFTTTDQHELKAPSQINHILIDNAFDEDDSNYFGIEKLILAPLCTMAFGSLLYPDNVVWATIDPSKTYRGVYPLDESLEIICNRFVQTLLAKPNDVNAVKTSSFFEVAVFNQITGCAESTFESAYASNSFESPETAPGLAHKLRGMRVIKVDKSFPTYDQAAIGVWNIIEERLQRLANRGHYIRNVAIQISTHSKNYLTLGSYVSKNGLMLPLSYKYYHQRKLSEPPVMIYASCFQKSTSNEDIDMISKEKSRAITKAISKLIEISITYEKESDNMPKLLASSQQIDLKELLANTFNSKSNDQIKYLGPAREEFDSFFDQAIYFLSVYCPNWRNNSQRQSYILPPIFYYKNSEVNDESAAKAQNNFQVEKEAKRKIQSLPDLTKQPKNDNTPLPEIISERIADKAENIVYEAIYQLIQEQVQTPFIAVRSLNMHLNFTKIDKDIQIHEPLTNIYRNINWDKILEIMKEIFFKDKPEKEPCLATTNDQPQKPKNRVNSEFDYVLIGPNIGMIVIEVKGSSFRKSGDFEKPKKFLPDGYTYGLKQLKSIEALIYLLQKCTGIPLDKSNVRKILFTPNLEQTRYKLWLNGLDSLSYQNVVEKIGEVTQWFSEDAMNLPNEISKPKLYSKLKVLLEDSSKFQIPDAVYNAYCPIIAAISSIVVHKDVQSNAKKPNVSETSEEILLGISNYSLVEANLKDAQRCVTSKFSEKNHKSESSLAKISKESATLQKAFKNKYSKVFCLSPDQLNAFKGIKKKCHKRQFLIGAAGTGKTIVLQAKANKLLNEDKSITVFSPKSYIKHYQAMFEDNDKEKYQVLSWTNLINETRSKFNESDRNFIEVLISGKSDLSAICGRVEKSMIEKDSLYKQLQPLIEFGHILIDDTLAEGTDPDQSMISALMIMAMSQKVDQNKYIWAAFDPIQYSQRHTEVVTEPRLLETLLLNSTQHISDSYYAVTVMQWVMRCSENIFKAAYSPDISWISKLLKPKSGHKIQGPPVFTIQEDHSDFESAVNAVSYRVASIIRDYHRERTSTGDSTYNLGKEIGIVFSGYYSVNNLKEKFIQQCENQLCDIPKIDLSTITVADCFAVSSLEWPLVLHIACTYKRSDVFEQVEKKRELYARYHAMSRATAHLIDINVSWIFYTPTCTFKI